MENVIANFAIRWWVVLIAVGINMIVGMLWYGPFFGQKWMGLVGFTEAQIKKGPHAILYVGSIVTSVITTYGLGFVINALGIESIAQGLLVTFVVWLTLQMAPYFDHLSFEGRPKALLAINGVYDLVVWMLVSILLVIS